ncbi:MAG: trigger factor [Alphaproteobacteria bacterium]|nr:trigger factor [Alphaproteobacteria bacterium]
MDIKEVKSEGLNKEYKVTIPSKKFDEKVAEQLAKIAKTVKIQGFRPGKAPKAMVEKQYKSSVVGEALETMIQEATAELIDSKKLNPATMPNVKISKFEEGKDIEVEISVENLPEIKLGDFAKINLDRFKAEVSAEEVEKALKYMAESRRETTKAPEGKKAEKNDTVVINFVGSIDGVEFQGGKGEKYPLVLGSNSFIPGFEDQLIGSKTGDKVDVKVKFPENYQAKELASKDSVFAVEVLDVLEPKKVEVNEDFAKSMGEKSLEDLKKKISERIAEDYDRATRMKLKRTLFDVLDKEYTFQAPKSLLDQEYDVIVKQYEQAKKFNQLDEDEKNRSEKDILAEYKEIALRRVKLGLLLSEIAKGADVKVEADDINKAIMAEARKYPGQEQAVLQYYLQNKQAVESLRAPIYEDKIVDHILAKVSFNDVVVSVEELFDFNEKGEKPAKKATKKAEPKAEAKEEKTSKPAAKKTAKK